MKPLPRSGKDYPSDASLYVFDFCGTLFDSNTSLDFLNWLVNRGVMSKGRFLTSRLSAGLGRRFAGLSPAQHMQKRTAALAGLSLAGCWLIFCFNFRQLPAQSESVPESELYLPAPCR